MRTSQASPAAAAPPSERRFVSNSDESCRMFQSDVMEQLSHVRPWVPHVIFVPVILVAGWLALQTLPLSSFVVNALLGVLAWTFTEYSIHRFLFHPPQWVEDDTRRIVSELPKGAAIMPAMPTLRHKFYFLVHGVHHDYPNDSTRLVMPPTVSVPLAVFFYLVFTGLAGERGLALFIGFTMGYLIYDTVHFANHHFAGSNALGRYLKKRHFRHHYSDSSRDFGVSSPLWDAIIGTLGDGRTSDRR